MQLIRSLYQKWRKPKDIPKDISDSVAILLNAPTDQYNEVLDNLDVTVFNALKILYPTNIHIKLIASEARAADAKVNNDGFNTVLPKDDVPVELKSTHLPIKFYAKAGNKVVDIKGEPLTLYHNTNEEFETFNPKKIKIKRGTILRGIYFSEKPDSQWGKITIKAKILMKFPLIFDINKSRLSVLDIQNFIILFLKSETIESHAVNVLIQEISRSNHISENEAQNILSNYLEWGDGIIIKNTKYSGQENSEYILLPSKKEDINERILQIKNPTEFNEGGNISQALIDIEMARSVKYWMEPEFKAETYHYPKTGKPNSFVVERNSGAGTIINKHVAPWVSTDIIAYDEKGKIVGTISISMTEPVGAFKIVVREDAQRRGWGKKLLGEAVNQGFDIAGTIKVNSFSSSGRDLLRSWLGDQAKKMKDGGEVKSAAFTITREQFNNYPKFAKWAMASKSGIVKDKRQRTEEREKMVKKISNRSMGLTSDSAPDYFYADNRDLYKEILKARVDEALQATINEDIRLSELPETEEFGNPFIVCTNVATWVKNNYFPTAKVVGYSIDNNPGAIGEDEGGHDFVLFDDRYIIDFWDRIAGDANAPIFYDLETDQELVKKYLGDQSTWETLNLKTGGRILLAPNGKPSNLTPEQYQLVRTTAFKAWFGDWENDPKNASRVVDENGEPMVVYHGTLSEEVFSEFKYIDEKRQTHAKQGFFFTNNIFFANSYIYDDAGENIIGRTIPVFLLIRNPFEVDAKFSNYEEININGKYYTIDQLAEIKSSVNDGVIVLNLMDTLNTDVVPKEGLGWGNSYAVYQSNQIKLADGTNTTFDKNNPDIRFEAGGKLIEDVNNLLGFSIDDLITAEPIGDDTKIVSDMISTENDTKVQNTWKQAVIDREKNPNPQLTLLSFGGGQDSWAILYSLIYDPEFRKKYAPNDLVVAMSDTGNEFPYTYQYVQKAIALCKEHGIHFQFITSDQGYHTPGWMNLKDNMRRNNTILGAAMGVKACTPSLKIQVVDKYMHFYMCEKYGFGPQYQKEGWKLYKEKFGTKARVLIGFAKDEENRVIKSNKNHAFLPIWKIQNIQFVYPLIEEGWNRAKAQEIIGRYRKDIPPPSNCMICFYQSDQELIWLERNHPEEFYDWVSLEKAKLDKHRDQGKKNYGVYGAITLLEKLEKAKEKYGHWTDEQLWEYKMSHGHCVKSSY